jgi:hypothetical protein
MKVRGASRDGIDPRTSSDTVGETRTIQFVKQPLGKG